MKASNATLIYFTALSIFIVFFIPYALASWDPYEVLGVRRDASPDQIKKAYRELARKLHPDKSNLSEDDAGKKFIELNKAFNILRDPKRRSRFAARQLKFAFGQVVNEESLSFTDRVILRIAEYLFRVVYYVTAGGSFSIVLILILCALVTSIFLYQTPNSPDIPLQTTFVPEHNHYDDLKIIELKAETYNGMIRLLRPGHRSIILLTDRENEGKLLAQFRKAVWPYRRNKTLLFGYLCLDKNLGWYKSLLQEILDIDDLNVNKRKCIGTVLSLNGYRKYFRIYHVKHREPNQINDDDEDASFLGFENQTSGVESGAIHRADIESKTRAQVDICAVENLLDRLPIWLDKMFDGLTERYNLDHWPENMK